MNDISFKQLIYFCLRILKGPFLFLLLFYSFYYGAFFIAEKNHWAVISLFTFLPEFKKGITFIILYWLVYNAAIEAGQLLLKWATNKNHTLFLIVFPAVDSSLRGILFIVMMNILVLSLHMGGMGGWLLTKAANILFILIVAWVFYKIISSLELYIINKYVQHNPDHLYSRKINTQLTILKRIIIFIGTLSTFIAITMLFDSVKGLGVSLLTTAGIVSAIGAFAGQQSLARLFAGLQLAFTQPIRMGDTVIIDNEFGQVEEITLSFITIKLWDLRRLILPTDYFTNKGLLNLTRESSELLGTVFLYADYTLPVDLIREKFMELLQSSPYWNKKVGALEVTDIKPTTMEIRCLMSANDASHLWKLRCEIREKLIKYIVDNYHNCLAKTRSLSLNNLSAAQPLS